MPTTRITKSTLLGFIILAFLTTALFSNRVSADNEANGYFYSDEQENALNDINLVREQLGLSKLTLDVDLTLAAHGHSTYLYANDEISHQQTKPLFATQATFLERLKAIAGDNFFSTKKWTKIYENISYRSSKYAIADLLEVPLHRVSLIDPNITHIGVGTTNFHNTVITLAGAGKSDYSKTPILYPYDGQEGVLLSQKSLESPDPFDNTGLNQSEAGFVLSVSTGIETKKSSLTISLTNSKGKAVPYIIRSADDNSSSSSNWLIIPKEQLKPLETYTFSVNKSTSVFQTMSKQQFEDYSIRREPEYIPYAKLNQMQIDVVSEGIGNKNTRSISNYSKDNVGIKLDGEYLELNPTAKNMNGYTFIPIRGVLEGMGAIVDYNKDKQSITITKGNKTIKMTINSSEVNVYSDGQISHKVKLDMAPFITEGTTYVPLRFISETVGAKVSWIPAAYTVEIATNIS